MLCVFGVWQFGTSGGLRHGGGEIPDSGIANA